MPKDFQKTCFCFICVMAFWPLNAFSQTPLSDAVAVWHMKDTADSTGHGNALTISGTPEFVPLSTKDAAESRLRGGNGIAAKLSAGGYFSAGQGANDSLNFSGQALSICIRLQVPSGKWDFPILAKHGGHDNLAYNVYSSADRIGCEFGTTKNKNLMTASVPFAELLPAGEGAATWHDVVCRVDGAKLEMFVDGRCVDEEFMMGDLRQNDQPLLIGAESYGEGNIKAEIGRAHV